MSLCLTSCELVSVSPLVHHMKKIFFLCLASIIIRICRILYGGNYVLFYREAATFAEGFQTVFEELTLLLRLKSIHDNYSHYILPLDLYLKMYLIYCNKCSACNCS